MGVGIKPETLKKMLIPAGITLGVILIIGLLIYMLAIPFNILIIGKLYSNIVARIVNLTGINQWLVKGIVIIALIPLIWVIPHLYWGKYKKSARAIALLYFGVFFLSLFFLSKDINFAHSGKDQIKKWYALTPEGVKFYDSAGVDTDYGITLRPVTPEVIRKLKLLQKGDFKPIDPANVQFFNPITGEAQVWFYKYPDGSYEFYDKPGYHHVTGEPLQAATKNVYLEWKEKQPATSLLPYYIRLFNCDDRCKAFVNDQLVVQTGFGEDSGRVSVGEKIHAGKNIIKMEVINDIGAITYGYEIVKGHDLIYHDSCGTAYKIGCENNRDFPIGIARSFTHEIYLPFRVNLENGVIGTWKWFNGIDVYIKNNGTTSNSDNGTGVWHMSDRDRNQITIRWNEGGWVDKLFLSPDGNKLDGRNQTGVHVFGERVK